MKCIGIKKGNLVLPFNIDKGVITYSKEMYLVAISLLHKARKINLDVNDCDNIEELLDKYNTFVTREECDVIIEGIATLLRIPPSDLDELNSDKAWASINRSISHQAYRYVDNSNVIIHDSLVIRSHPRHTDKYCLDDIMSWVIVMRSPLGKFLHRLRDICVFTWDRSPKTWALSQGISIVTDRQDVYTDIQHCQTYLSHVAPLLGTVTLQK